MEYDNIDRETNNSWSLTSGKLCMYLSIDVNIYWAPRVTVDNSERDGNTRPPGLPLEKHTCRSGSNS